MSGVTTHVLDLTHGLPADHVAIDLYYTEPSSESSQLIKTAVTNSDGRLDQPLLSEEEVRPGRYELVFHIGDYFRSKRIQPHNPAFLEDVPVRFYILQTNRHYHVPLLISPYGYQIYRGS
ncbi:hydroxyisourate hydrolase [Peribacillus kribbensis]|uniref:hydroxyisourate hydrolase n=1 Tax=Peribacillus kribbensis TaxID=356658 RepID=UPI000407461D|nr:hydroxyisourate hydrolase [Peribacillus kribbensis]